MSNLASTVCTNLQIFSDFSDAAMKSCSFCSSKKCVFLLKPEVKTHLKIPKELWSAFNYICADHFEPNDLSNGQRKRLKYDAFPTTFPQPLESYFEQFFDAQVREGVKIPSYGKIRFGGECQHGPLPSTDRKPYMAKGQKLMETTFNFQIFVQTPGFDKRLSPDVQY